MKQAFHHPQDVLFFACSCLDANEAVALVIVTRVTGGAMRSRGAMMCISVTGDVAGYVSNGCVDADIMFQARQAIEVREIRKLVYGEGSPFKDIDLPCGGRIDLVVIPRPDELILRGLYNALAARNSAALTYSIENGLELKESETEQVFTHIYKPKLKLRIVGKGDAVISLAQQSQQSGFEVKVQSPDEDMSDALGGIAFQHLTTPTSIPVLEDDPWTAVVVMFHDHAWEPDILKQALSGAAFYIGAMGSARTHANRIKMLQELDVDPSHIARVRGPIGLVPSMRDANLLALSTLAEIVSVAQEAGCL